MGQIVVPGSPPALILSAVDRLVASNADGGLNPNASHIVLLGENAGKNLGDVDYVYVIGANSLDAGLVNTVNQGTVVYGALSLSGLINSTPAGNDGPITVVGYNNLPTQTQQVGSAVIIGNDIEGLAAVTTGPTDACVLIGSQIFERQLQLIANGGAMGRRSVVIGYRVGRGTAFVTQGAGTSFTDCVILGSEAAENAGFESAGPGTSVVGTIIIGRQAARTITSTSGAGSANDILIGTATAAGYSSGSGNVVIGALTTLPATASQRAVLIGDSVVGSAGVGTIGNVVIGSGGNINGFGSRNILIGWGANGNGDLSGAVANRLLIESVDSTSTVKRTSIYGLMSDASPGGLVLGNSGAANRDVPGFNIVKLINGTVTGVAPVGGGFAYSTGGELHWVSTGNVDTALTPGGGLGLFTVATLPAAPPAQSRAFVSNALAPAFTVAVAGGGAVFTPVYFDGAAWRCG